MQGTIEGHKQEYKLDQGHTFEKGKPALVCGNTAAMLGEDGHSWLAPHFQVPFRPDICAVPRFQWGWVTYVTEVREDV